MSAVLFAYFSYSVIVNGYRDLIVNAAASLNAHPRARARRTARASFARSTLPPLTITPTRLPSQPARHASSTAAAAEAAGRLDDHLHALGEEAHRRRPAAASLDGQTSVDVAPDDRERVFAEMRASARRRRSSAACRYARSRRARATAAPSLPASGSTPITLHAGASARRRERAAARAARRRRGTRTAQSSAPTSSISSFAAVPCPAITCGWSYGGISVMPRSSASLRPIASRSCV